jgi:hypothetical protein
MQTSFRLIEDVFAIFSSLAPAQSNKPVRRALSLSWQSPNHARDVSKRRATLELHALKSIDLLCMLSAKLEALKAIQSRCPALPALPAGLPSLYSVKPSP